MITKLVVWVKLLGSQLLSPGNTLTQKVIQAGFWSFTLRFADRLFQLIRIIVLARLLSPEDFGLFGIALLVLAMLETFSETGFNAAIIQKKGDVRPYLDTVWTVQVIRAFLLAAILLTVAPYVAMFFGEPETASLVRILALVMVFRGLSNVGVLYFRKELEFHKEFIYMFSGTLVDLGVSITATLIWQNAYALVFGLVAGQCVRMLVSYVVHPYRPRLRLEWAKAKELFIFGRWIFGLNVMVFLATYGDDVFLGKILGAAAIGLYQMAYRFSNMMTTEITHVISQVTFPAYSKIQDDVFTLRKAFMNTVEAVFVLSLPLCVILLTLSNDFVRLFLGEAWLSMVTTLQILALSGMLRSIAATGGPLFQAVKRPNLDFWMSFSRLCVIVVTIYPLTIYFGLEGTAVSVFLGTLIMIPIWWEASWRITGINHRMFFTRTIPSLAATVIMFISIVVIKWLITASYFSFFLLIGVGMLCYITTFLVIWRKCKTDQFILIKRR